MYNSMKRVSFNERSKADTLHIELPGCIVNVRLVTNGLGQPVTLIDISANADRYTGEPAWYIAPDCLRDGRPEGMSVRVVRDKPLDLRTA